jgi:uncharacterized protein YndB with AHSA1/START domain
MSAEHASEHHDGPTRDQGFQVGASRTLDATVGEAWELLTSSWGLGAWLGDGAMPEELEPGATYETADGARGEIVGLRAHDRVRATWQPADRDEPTVVQFTVLDAPGDRVAIRLVQEGLADGHERERMQSHWNHVMDAIEIELSVD